MENYLSVVLGVRIHSYSQARSVYGVLGSVRDKLYFSTAPTLTKTLQNVSNAICAHYARLCEMGHKGFIKGYACHLRILGENVIFFDTQGRELDDDISIFPYRYFSFETLFGSVDSFLEPNLPTNAKRHYIPRNDDYRKWRMRGIKMGIIATNTPKDYRRLKITLKSNDKISYVLINGQMNGKDEISYLVYVLDNRLNLRELLCDIGARFCQKSILYSANGADFECVYMSGILPNEMLYNANVWDKNGNFSTKDYECLREHFGDKYKVAQYADKFAK